LNAEGGIHGLDAVVAVVHPVHFARGQAAMDEQEVRVAPRLGVIEIRRHSQRGERLRQRLAAVDLALAVSVLSVAGSPHLVGDGVELRLVVALAGAIGGFRPHHHRAGVHHVADLAQDRH